jgi:hypothetical protein
MKTYTEIEKLAFKSYGDTLLKGSFIHGYTQCQEDMAEKYTEQDMIKFAFDTYYQEDMAKKYTEEDVIRLMFNATKWDTFKEGEVGYNMTLSQYFNYCLHSLNKQD